MRLGIDLGTTRTVVAAADRGNYPVVGFATAEGDIVDYCPTVTAEQEGVLVHGHEAEAAARRGAPVLRSWKRLLAEHGAEDVVRIGRVQVGLLALVTQFATSLRRDLDARANVPGRLDEEPEITIAVPANAHSTQRFTTLEAFRRAGFRVLALLNEPSAAGLEYAHRHRRTLTSKREHVVVYDLGGGTFDAALVRMSGRQHDVLCTSGIARLGGDDFDEALLELALEQVGADSAGLSAVERDGLLLECRAAKEGIHPNTRRIALELGGLGAKAPVEPVVVAVADFYERIRPLVERSREALEPVAGRAAREQDMSPRLATPRAGEGSVEPQLAGLYVVGGGSGLPLVPRVLRERFGRRVHRSAYPSAATAIGLAIAASAAAVEGVGVTERFTRHLGVFREQAAGARVSFDGIFSPGTPMPKVGEPPLLVTRSYRAAHNVGVFRYVECSALDAAGEPCGDITPHGMVYFPFVGDAQQRADGEAMEVGRLPTPGPRVEERYEVDASGVVAVTIVDLDSRFSRRYVL